MVLRIGVHPNNLHLRLAALWPGAFDDLDHVFVAYPEGRDTGRLLAEGVIDIGGTGSTPPILAAAAGQEVVYAAASATRPANGAVLVARDGPVDSIAALKGRAVALVDGSFLTYFLARSLDEAGLTLRDVERRDLPPALSRTLLAGGEVAAWVAMAPHLEQVLATGEAKVLTHCGTTIPNRSVFWTVRDRGLSAATLAAFAAGLARVGAGITAAPERAAALLAGPAASETERRAWTRVVAERDWQVVPADARIHAEQQAEADTLTRHGDLAAALHIEQQPA